MSQEDAKQILDFLNSIEGHGYGGTAEFEIALEAAARGARNIQPFNLSPGGGGIGG